MVKKNNKDVKGINGWLFASNVLVAAINKGQGIPYLIGAVLFLMILKMPGTEVSKLAFSIFDAIINWSIVGWVLALFVLPAWFIHAKSQRKIFYDEITRVVTERNRLQAILSNSDIQSSTSKKT